MSCKYCNLGPYRSFIIENNIKKIKNNILNIINYIYNFIQNKWKDILFITISLTLLFWLFLYNPKVDYCYADINYFGLGNVHLYGSKKFASDKDYGYLDTSINLESIKKAKDISQKLNCEFTND